MFKAIKKFTLFLALLILLDRIIYAGAGYLRDNGGHADGMDIIYKESSWNPSVMFLGDSRTKRNFDMQVVERATRLSAYDFGYDNASAEEALFILEQYLSHKPHPRVVVFEADPQMLDRRYGSFHKEHFRDYVTVFPDPDQLLREISPTLKQRASTLAVNWLMNSASIPNRLPDLWNDWRSARGETVQQALINPCGPAEMHQRCRYYNGAETFSSGDNGEQMTWQPLQFNIDAERTELFEHVVWLAEQKGFSLIFAETPRLDGDLALSPDSRTRAEAYFCRLAREHPRVLYARITHVDGMDRDRSLYWDWVHFNGLGATKISQVIAPLITAMDRGSRPEACLFE